jgi:Fe-Mn family superoxide dismutase
MNDQDPLSRRELLLRTAAVGGAAVLGSLAGPAPRQAAAEDSPGKGAIALPPLPYAENALEPVISAKTISFHYGKHHKAYIDKVLAMTKGTPMAEESLEKIVAAAAADPAKQALFNNAAQAWNHAFYWNSMKPGGGGAPEGKLLEKVTADMGGIEKLKKELADAAAGQFGSGWAWLVVDGGKLKVEKTQNADNPLVHGKTPLLTIDVWEHAYYLDYQNKRPDYISGVIDKLLNWEFAAKNLPA